MNVTTNYPNVSLVTTNPATDRAARDNAVRPVVPPVTQLNATGAEPAVAGNKEKAQPNTPIIATQNPTYEQPQNPAVSENEKNEQQSDEQKDQQDQNQHTDEENDNDSERFSEQEQQQIDQLKQRDTEVVAHEKAHSSTGGQYAGSPSYSYETGPDGAKYAVSGEVSIDTAKVPNDPQATLIKAQQIRRAALAPAQPSSQDRSVAATADRLATQARQEILSQAQTDKDDGKKDFRINNPIESERFNERSELAQDKEFQKTVANRSQHINDFYHQSSQSNKSATLYQQA